MNNGRSPIQLPRMPQQPVAMQVASPVNDLQMVALIAAQLLFRDETTATPAAAARVAVELFAQAVIQGQTLPTVMRQLQANEQATAFADAVQEVAK